MSMAGTAVTLLLGGGALAAQIRADQLTKSPWTDPIFLVAVACMAAGGGLLLYLGGTLVRERFSRSPEEQWGLDVRKMAEKASKKQKRIRAELASRVEQGEALQRESIKTSHDFLAWRDRAGIWHHDLKEFVAKELAEVQNQVLNTDTREGNRLVLPFNEEHNGWLQMLSNLTENIRLSQGEEASVQMFREGSPSWSGSHWVVDPERDLEWSLPSPDGSGILLRLRSKHGSTKKVHYCRITDAQGNDLGTHDATKQQSLIVDEGEARLHMPSVDSYTLGYPIEGEFANAPVSINEGSHWVEWRAVAGVGTELVKRDYFEIKDGRLVR